MKMFRLENGSYQSEDRKVHIERIIKLHARKAKETLWEITIDGRDKTVCKKTYRDARDEAAKMMGEPNSP